MKNKIILLAIVSIVAFSCATKTKVATTETVKEEIIAVKDYSEGKALYENNCARCHKLYDTKEFSAEDWKPIVERMRKKAKLTEEEGAKIYDYVTSM